LKGRLLRFRRARLSDGLFEGRKPVTGVVNQHFKSREDSMARALDSALEIWKRLGMQSRHSSPGWAPPFAMNFTVPERRLAQFLRPIESGRPKLSWSMVTVSFLRNCF